MPSITICVLVFVAFGIIVLQLTSAQQRQRSSMSLARRGRIPRFFRNQATQSGSRTRASRGRQELPGPRHSQPETTKSRIQLLSNVGKGSLPSRPTLTGTNRFRTVGNRRRFSRPSNAMVLSALRRQSQPTKTSETQPSATRNLPVLGLKPSMINDQLKIFARNLKVIDGTIELTRRPTSAKTGRSKDKRVSMNTETMPKEQTQITQSNRVLPKSGRTGRQRIAPTRIAPTSPKGNPTLRSPLRIRARLRQISSQVPKTVHRKAPDPSNINTRNDGAGNNNGGGRKVPGRQRDMIAIDDIISLVNAIRGGKDPNPVSSQSKPSDVTTKISKAKNDQNINNNALIHNSKTSSNKKGNNNNIAVTNTSEIKAPNRNNQRPTSGNHGNSGIPMQMLVQLALMTRGESGMNGGENGGVLSGIFSNPAFLQQISTGSGGNLLQMMLTGSENKKTGKGGENMPGNKQINLNDNPSVLQELSGMKIPKTGNPIQDQMISSLLAHTMTHFREEIQENLRKRMYDGDSPSSRRKYRPTTQEPNF